MNDNLHSDSESTVPWPNGGNGLPVPDKSMLLESGDTLPPAAGMFDSAVQGAHDTIDHLTDATAPAMRQLGDRASAAKAALQEKTTQLRDTGDQWADSVRAKVRGNPLVSIVAALALGALLAGLTRTAR
jgi:hypothetical protein